MNGDRPPSHKRWIGAYYLRIGWIDGAARASQSLEQRVEGLSLLRLSRVVKEQGEANLFGLCRAQETQGNKPNISDCRSRNSPAAFDKGKNWNAAFQTRIGKNCQTTKGAVVFWSKGNLNGDVFWYWKHAGACYRHSKDHAGWPGLLSCTRHKKTNQSGAVFLNSLQETTAYLLLFCTILHGKWGNPTPFWSNPTPNPTSESIFVYWSFLLMV